jgi:hypothetical protein
MSRRPWVRNVLFVAAVLLALATFVLFWTMRDNVSFSYYPNRMGVTVALGVLAVCCGAAGSLVAQRVRSRGG